MSIAHSGIERYIVAAKFFVQAADKSLSFATTNLSAAIAPDFPVTNGYQIAPKNDLSFVNRDAHAMSLNGATSPIIYLRVIT
jgi:hypothetical protein